MKSIAIVFCLLANAVFALGSKSINPESLLRDRNSTESIEINSYDTLIGSSRKTFLAESPSNRPRVEKFAQDVYYDVYYSQSAVYDYVKAFFTGYNF